jgi:hypothetical protein
MEDTLRRNALMILVILAAAASLAAQTAQLKDISTRRDGARLIVDIAVEGSFSKELTVLQFPSRLVIDLSPVDRIGAAPFAEVQDLGLLSVRTGQFKPDTARVVFDLSDRTPAFSVAAIPGGVRISFWYEGGEEPLPQKPAREDVKPEPAKPVPAEPAPAARAEETGPPGRSDFFLGARGGLTFLLSPKVETPSSFSLFGETGSLLETHDLTSGPAFDFVAGKHFGRFKAGAGMTIWKVKQDPTFTLSLPHPYQANSPREVVFTAEQVSNGMTDFYAFFEYAFYDSETFSVWAGVVAGLTKGSFQNLDDYDYAEVSPYGASDITISNVTTVEETYSALLFGGLLSFEYRIGTHLSVIFDAKMLYANPKLLNLGLRANFLRVQPVLGLQFNF